MAENKKSYCIIKRMKPQHPLGRTQHVILVNTHSEIQEWDNKEDADAIAALFNANSDSGYEYVVRDI